MKTCFFTILQDSYKNYSGIEYNLFEKSFKHFHPDIPLFVVGDKEIAELRKSIPSLDLFKMKASAAKLFYNDYDLVVNIDSDHFFFDRLDEILAGDFDVAAPSNFNYYENVSLKIESYNGKIYNIVPDQKYIQAGLVASTSKEFWDTYEKASVKHADHMTCKDNDVLNLVVEFGNFDFKVLDGGWTPNDVNRHSYYGCSSLNLEKECTIVNGKPFIRGKPLKCYHVARGGAKPKFNQLFNEEVVTWLNEKIK
jgi:hypothetical protein